MGESKLTIILPAYNEEKSIGRVIDEIRSLPVKCDILVVDNRSINGTFSIASSKEVKVVVEEQIGKGNAMKRGFKEAETPYVIMMDSDYTYPAIYLQELYKLLSGGCDVVVGYRKWKQCGSMTPLNSFGNRLLSLLASILYGYDVYDVCSGMWGFRKEVLDTFDIGGGGFTLEAELFINSVRSGCTIVQRPMVYRRRLEGDRAKLKVWDGFKIGWFLVKRRFTW